VITSLGENLKTRAAPRLALQAFVSLAGRVQKGLIVCGQNEQLHFQVLDWQRISIKEPLMSTQTFTTIRSARTQAEAALLISVLRQAGLHPLDLDIAGHYSLAGADIDYAVQVPTVEAAEARAVLTSHEANVSKRRVQ
jgi:hypothetical protein